MLSLKFLILLLSLQFTFFSEAKDERSSANTSQCALYISGSPETAIAELEVSWKAKVSERLLNAFLLYSSQNNLNMNDLRHKTKNLNIQSYIFGVLPINIEIAKTLAQIFELELDYVLAKDLLQDFNSTQFEVRPEHFKKKFQYNLSRVFKFLFWDLEVDRDFMRRCLESCPDDLLQAELRRRGLI